MAVETLRVYTCSLAGCNFTTSDPSVGACMVVMDVMIPESTGLMPLSGSYCSKGHAIQALRELPEPSMVLNPLADELTVPG